MSERSCATCKFFFGVHEDDDPTKKLLGGQCRRRAPTVGFVLLPRMRRDVAQAADVMVPSIERCSAWPHVAADVWCGEFEALVVH